MLLEWQFIIQRIIVSHLFKDNVKRFLQQLGDVSKVDSLHFCPNILFLSVFYTLTIQYAFYWCSDFIVHALIPPRYWI